MGIVTGVALYLVANLI